MSITATRSTTRIMPATLNFQAAVPMLVVMNAIAEVSPAHVSGSKLDNRRVMAAIVDLLIVTAGASVVLFAGDSLTGDRKSALGAVILGWALYYFFALESGTGQTVGKKLMKLRVVRADGRAAGMREVAVRTILRVVDNYLVGLIVMLATGERRQRIGDLAAGTIVVDASAPPVAPPPAPVVDAVVEDEAEEDEPATEAEPARAQTITLPARPAPPATLADLTEPEVDDPVEPEPVDEAPAVPEPRPFPPVEEPVVEAQPVPVEPAVEVHDELPPVTSPSLEELAQDVAAAHGESEVEEVEEQAEPADELPQDDEPVNVKSVETVSAMDLIMGAADENAGEQSAADAGDAAGSAQDGEDAASR